MSNVNHPKHYNMGNIEVIDAIDDWGLGFCDGNVVKYVARAGHKDPAKELEVLQKAAWYLDHYIQTKGGPPLNDESGSAAEGVEESGLLYPLPLFVGVEEGCKYAVVPLACGRPKFVGNVRPKFVGNVIVDQVGYFGLKVLPATAFGSGGDDVPKVVPVFWEPDGSSDQLGRPNLKMTGGRPTRACMTRNGHLVDVLQVERLLPEFSHSALTGPIKTQREGPKYSGFISLPDRRVGANWNSDLKCVEMDEAQAGFEVGYFDLTPAFNWPDPWDLIAKGVSDEPEQKPRD